MRSKQAERSSFDWICDHQIEKKKKKFKKNKNIESIDVVVDIGEMEFGVFHCSERTRGVVSIQQSGRVVQHASGARPAARGRAQRGAV
jgi:predicted  nucleic acid-binding Zn-ribbon protein